MTLNADRIPLAENPYGVAKRFEVIRSWVRDISEQSGTSTLHILDYGCGTGDHLTAPLARCGHSVLGVDTHAPSIAEAQRRHELPALTFRTGDIEGLLAERLRFDIVICSEVLEHVDDPSSVLRQLRALTAPGGVVIITTPNGHGSFELLCTTERWMKRIGAHQVLRWCVWKLRQATSRLHGAPMPSRPLDHVSSDEHAGFLNFDSGHVQFFRIGRLENLFEDAGLRIVARRARTTLCGPYVDAVFALCPWRDALFRWNNCAADILPFRFAADWMFLLQPEQ